MIQSSYTVFCPKKNIIIKFVIACCSVIKSGFSETQASVSGVDSKQTCIITLLSFLESLT